jgi:hypothetical protein
MHQTSTNHRRQHRRPIDIPGQQLCMDAYSHPHESRSRVKYCNVVTDLASGYVVPVFANNRSATELCHKHANLFFCHPSWQQQQNGVRRFIRVDPEKNYMSQEFLELLHDFGYAREETPPSGKHANRRAERTVDVIEVKTNTTMLHASVPQAFWDLAMIYTCHTHAFNPLWGEPSKPRIEPKIKGQGEKLWP